MAARKPSPKDAPVDFEDLIAAPAEDLAQVPVPVSENEGDETKFVTTVEDGITVLQEETPAQRRIRELKAELEKPIPVASDDDDDDQIEEETEEDREIKELETQLAIRNAKILDEAKERYRPAKGKVVIIHVETDGFTEFGRVWLRGQNIHIGTEDYKRTLDRNGKSWLDTMVENPSLQYQQWGAVYIGPGEFVPRPGEAPFEDEVAREDARRQGKVPYLAPGTD